MRTPRKAPTRKRNGSEYPSEAFVHARIREQVSDSGDHRRIETENGPELWAHVHDHHIGYDEAERRGKPVRIMLVFNCRGLAEIAGREPGPRLVPLDDERSGHYRFVGRVKSVIERKTPSRTPTDIPDNSIWHSVILDAEIPLWCHFYARKATHIESGSVIDVTGEVMMELQ